MTPGVGHTVFRPHGPVLQTQAQIDFGRPPPGGPAIKSGYGYRVPPPAPTAAPDRSGSGMDAGTATARHR